MFRNICIALCFFISGFLLSQEKQNVLFIAIDDLKPLLGAYGDTIILTPEIDKLAQQSVVFTNAHCQQAVCGPSRASVFTGMRPDYTGVWDLKTKMRDVNPDILAMPEYFKNNGYKTVGIGKIYDPRCVDKQYDNPSWSISYKQSSNYTYPKEYGKPGLSFYASPENQKIVKKYTKEAKDKGVKNIHNYVSKRYKPSTEIADVDDAAYMDTQIANNAISYLEEFSKSKEPFFLAVGFKKPHLPFAAPKKYWDLYNRDDISLAEFREPIKNDVPYAYHVSGELQSYTDISELTSFNNIFTDNLPDDKQKELIHGYMASVSYIDAQVGRILSYLKKQGLDDNTIIVLWGDHGWHLGDHSMWCKHSNFEQATRVPLMLSIPNKKTGYNASPIESIDIFPSLCEAAGLNIPSILQGESLLPIFNNEKSQIKDFAVSQFGRGKREGYSIRTDRYRLTLWMNDNYRTFMPFKESLLDAGELYDYQLDPLETVNVYNDTNYTAIKAQLMNMFIAFVEKQNNELKNSGSINFLKTKKGR